MDRHPGDRSEQVGWQNSSCAVSFPTEESLYPWINKCISLLLSHNLWSLSMCSQQNWIIRMNCTSSWCGFNQLQARNDCRKCIQHSFHMATEWLFCSSQFRIRRGRMVHEVNFQVKVGVIRTGKQHCCSFYDGQIIQQLFGESHSEAPSVQNSL